MDGRPAKNVLSKRKPETSRFGKELEAEVIGQAPAIEAVSKALRRSRADIKDPKRPIGSFLFLGPTGVGKTYLAKILAEHVFGKEDAMIHLDMTEYMEKFSTSVSSVRLPATSVTKKAASLPNQFVADLIPSSCLMKSKKPILMLFNSYCRYLKTVA